MIETSRDYFVDDLTAHRVSTTIPLYSSADDVAPLYKWKAGTTPYKGRLTKLVLSELAGGNMDFSSLPVRAFEKFHGPMGSKYKVPVKFKVRGFGLEVKSEVKWDDPSTQTAFEPALSPENTRPRARFPLNDVPNTDALNSSLQGND